jgi:hypothetical protein
MSDKCPVCGGVGKCVSLGGTVSQEPFSMEDWKDLYEFLTEKELPFVHSLIARARARNKFAKVEKRIEKRSKVHNN